MKQKTLCNEPAKTSLRDILSGHAHGITDQSLLQLYSADPEREEKLRWKLGPIQLNMTLQRLSSQTLQLLVQFAKQEGMPAEIGKLFSRKFITPEQPGGHWLLRQHTNDRQFLNELDQVRAENARMSKLAHVIRSGQWKGATGHTISHVVYLASGGPSTVAQLTHHALWDDTSNVKISFASALDGMQLCRLFSVLPPERTLFIVASKSFTTADTLANHQLAHYWLSDRLGKESDLGRHFIGISSSADRMLKAGIPQENQLLIPNWVGGRFSSCSVFSFPMVLARGDDAFKGMQKGAELVDHHFRTAPLENNIPALMALVDIWNRNFLGIQNRILLPYDDRLSPLPLFSSQLELESCGKASLGDSEKQKTAGMVLGEPGLNARHSLHEYIHNGSDSCSCEFILSKEAPVLHDKELQNHIANRHEASIRLCHSTARQFAFEDSREQSKHRIPGTPSSIIELENLSPESLGALIALYEHRTFAQSTLWKVNPFDQKGVDRDKIMSGDIYNASLGSL